MFEMKTALNPPTPHIAINILIVDDREANRTAFQSILQPLGYATFLADNGSQAIELAKHLRFSVILLDVRMPILSGIETALELRENRESRSTPIIFVSAFEETHLEVSRAGVDGGVDFIFSPVNPEILIWKVRNWVDLFIRQALLRRQATRVSEAHQVLQALISKSPLGAEDVKQADARLATALRQLIESLSEGLGVQV